MLALNFVYVVGDGRAAKIGKSTTPEARIASLNPGSSAPLVTYYVGATNGDGGAIDRGSFLAVGFSPSRRNGSLPRRITGSSNRGRRDGRRTLGGRCCDGGRTEWASGGFPVDPSPHFFVLRPRTAAAAWDWRRGVCEYEDCALSGSSAPRRRAGRARSCIALDWGRMRPWRA